MAQLRIIIANLIQKSDSAWKVLSTYWAFRSVAFANQSFEMGIGGTNAIIFKYHCFQLDLNTDIKITILKWWERVFRFSFRKW